MTADLAASIASSVARLGRFGASYPIFLQAPRDHEVIAASELLATDRLPAYFRRAILEWTADPEAEDIRAAASRFARRYCGSVAAAALIPLLNGVAVDVALDRLSFVIRSDMPMGVVLAIDPRAVATTPERPTDWPVRGRDAGSVTGLREAALASLVADNLVPGFGQILAAAHVSTKLLWSTAAEQIDLLYENAADGPDPALRAAAAADREAVLFSPGLPGFAGPNPMLDLLEWETVDDPAFPRPLQVRRICCINYVIPGRQAYCRTCGLLQPEERLALWRSWRASLVDPAPHVAVAPRGPG